MLISSAYSYSQTPTPQYNTITSSIMINSHYLSIIEWSHLDGHVFPYIYLTLKLCNHYRNTFSFSCLDEVLMEVIYIY